MLLRRALVSAEGIEQALANQVVFGGRIGTNLVELQLVPLDLIGRALSIQHGVPQAATDALEEASPETLCLVPGELCARHGVFPLARTEGGALHLAMLDPHHGEVIDELALLTGLSIVPHVCPELRLLYFLERRYGIPRPARFVRAPDGSRRRTHERRTYLEPTISPAREFPAAEEDAAADDAVFIVVGPPVGDFPPGGAAESETEPVVELSESELVILDEWTPPERSPELDEVLRSLDDAVTGGEIAQLLVHPLWPDVSLGVLFWVRGKMAIACCAHQTTLPVSRIQQLVVSLDEPSLMQWSFATRSPVRSASSSDPFQEQVASFFGAPLPAEACVAPVVMRGAVINLVCIQQAAGSAIPESAFADLTEICKRASQAYQRLARQIPRPVSG